MSLDFSKFSEEETKIIVNGNRGVPLKLRVKLLDAVPFARSAGEARYFFLHREKSEQPKCSNPACSIIPAYLNGVYTDACSIKCKEAVLRIKYDEAFAEYKIKYPWIEYLSEGDWCKENNITQQPQCKSCGKPVKFVISSTKYYQPYCSTECCNSNEDLSKQRVESLKRNLLEQYGVDNIISIPGMKEKRENTWKEKYGTTHPMKNKEVQQRQSDTWLKNYGESHIMHVAEIHERSRAHARAFKTYQTPSGKIIKLQGWEYFAYLKLIEEGFSENDIETGRTNMPHFYYLDEAGKRHRYYPDLFIKSLNTYVEVKSTFTIKTDKNLEKKQDSVLESGNSFRLMVVEPTKEEFRQERLARQK